MRTRVERLHTLLRWLGLALCAALAMLVRGYEFGKSDQNLYLPFVYHWNDPSLFPHDYLLQLGYAKGSVIWVLVAAAGRAISLPPLFLILQYAAVLLFFVLIYKCVLLLSDDRLAAWLAVLLWLPAYEIAGARETSFDYYFTTRSIGWVLAAGALYFFLKDRPAAAGCFLFAGVLVHVVSVLPLAGGLCLALMVERKWRLAAGFAGLVASAGALLALFSRSSGLSHGIWVLYEGDWLAMLWRHVPDLFPQSWPLVSWGDLAACAGTFCVLVAACSRARQLGTAGGRLVWVASGAAATALLGLAGAYFGVGVLAQLSLNRGFSWIALSAALLAAGGLARCARAPEAWIKFASAYLMISWIFGDDSAHLLAGAALSLLLVANVPLAGSGRRTSLALASVFMAGLLILQLSRFCEAPLSRPLRYELSLPASAFFMGCLFLLQLPLRRWFPWPSPLLMAAALGLTFFFFPTDFLLLKFPMEPPTARFVPQLQEAWSRRTAWQAEEASREAMELVIRQRVPKDCTLIVSPHWTDFRLRTLRSPFVLYKDRSGALYDKDFAFEWLARMKKVHAIPPRGLELEAGPALTDEELKSLSKEYEAVHLDYAVLPSGLDLPRLATAGPWSLYTLGPAEENAQGKGK